MSTLDLDQHLRRSLDRQQMILRGSLVLNPVENFPFPDDLSPSSTPIHGLYNTDKLRSEEQRRMTKHQFAGRGRLAYDSQRIYSAWSKALGAEDVSLRLLSGLHAHAVIFMSIAKAGDKVLLLPEVAGGHMSTQAILERLGMDVILMIPDLQNHRVDVDQTIEVAQAESPRFVFVDRSEGLNYEDFSRLNKSIDATKIFDASQYLSNIIAKDHVSPFDMGFEKIVATVHKNFPGPQKALVATKTKDEIWTQLLGGISTYVSNMHTFHPGERQSCTVG